LVFRFLNFKFSNETLELHRNGEAVSIEPRLAALLALLLRDRDRILSRDDIERVVWEGRAVSEGSVGVAIAGLRRALGDNRTRSRVIRTVYGRGYQFVASVTEVQETASARRGESGDLIGRSTELAALGKWIQRARFGELSVSVVTGEPGIGKSKLLGTACQIARRDGFYVHQLRCGTSDDLLPPLWTQIAQQTARDRITRLPGGSETNPPDSDFSPGSIRSQSDFPLSPTSIRHRQFEAIATHLARSAVLRPLLVAIDDLHLADRHSLVLIRHLCLSLTGHRIAFVVAYRDSELGAKPYLLEVISRLSKETLLQRVNLQGLSTKEIGRLVAVKTGVPPNVNRLVKLSNATRGNPLFLLSVLSSADAPKGLDFDAPMPSDILSAVTAHVSSLPERVLQSVVAASVLGYSFRVSLLADSLGRETDWIRHGILAATRKRILFRRDKIDETFEFSHPLLRDALYALAGHDVRSRIHRSAANVLARDGIDRVCEERIPELAIHLFRATDRSAIPLLLRAGDLEERSFEFEKAAQHYVSALQLADSFSCLSDPERFVSLVSIGRCLIQVGDRNEASKYFRKAISIARRVEFTPRMVRETLRASPDFFSIECGVVDSSLVELLNETYRGMCATPDIELKARVAARLLLAVLWSNSHQGLVRSLVDFLTECAGEVPARALYDAILPAVWRAHWTPATLHERLAVKPATELCADNSPDASLVQQLYYISALLESGQLSLFDDQVRKFGELAESLRHPQGLWYAEMFSATRFLLIGDFDHAETARERFAERARMSMDANGVHTAALHEFMLLWEKRRLDELVSRAERSSARYPNVPGWRAILAFTYLEIGREEDGVREFEALKRRGFASIPMRIDWPSTFTLGLAQTAARLKDEFAARQIYNRLVGIRGREAIAGIGAMACGSVDRYLGLLAGTFGATDLAQVHLGAAIKFDTALGAKPWAAHAEFDLAELLWRIGRTDDAKKCVARVSATAQRLGMENLNFRARKLARRLNRGGG